MNDLRSLVKLSLVPGVGSQRMNSLLQTFGCVKDVFEAPLARLKRIPSIDKQVAEAIKKGVAEADIERVMRVFEEKKIAMIDRRDERYPELLKKIYQPPYLIYVRGDWELLAQPSLAIVGMRACSVYGTETAQRFGEEFSQQGVVVVSGMARGIDSAAHRGAIRGKGGTVAVLGCGIDVIYPSENRKLYHNIINEGAIVSEYPPATEPHPGFFPRRNRIISGLTRGTLVVEAGKKSGALITAYNALEQDREIFAVPGRIDSNKSRGAHKLLRQGAKLVERCEDVFAELPGLTGMSLFPRQRQPHVCLSERESTIAAELDKEPIHIDTLCEKLELSSSEVLPVLLTLELKNCLKQLTGMRFIRK